MGAQRLRTVRRKPPEPGSKTTGKSHGVHHSSHSTNIQRIKEMQSLVGNQKTTSMLGKKPDQVTDPSLRDALNQQAHGMFDQVIKTLPALLSLTSPLLAQTSQVTPGGPSPGTYQLVGELNNRIQMLDIGIQMYEQAGGQLSDIYPIIAVRAELSTALFHARLALGGAPVGPVIHTHVINAISRGGSYYAEQTIKKAQGMDAVQGPMTQQDHARKEAEDQVLRSVFLGPPGEIPTASGLKN